MIDSFNVGGESEVGFWAGITSSVFFFAQFLTSLLWASIADRYGRRAVLLASLCGNALTLVTFGASTNLKMALTVRLAQGLFNGAVGVAKGAIRDLTDPTNEGRAYAILGFAWGFGGIAGPILGGLLEHPTDKLPALFGNIELFKTYPYLLPCLVGASFTTLGAFLSLFIGPDGGPCQGQIRLQGQQGVAEATAMPARNSLVAAADNIDSLGRSAGKRISGLLTGATHSDAEGQDGGGEAGASHISLGRTSRRQQLQNNFPRTFTQQVDEETGGPPSPIDSDDEDTLVTRRCGRPPQCHLSAGNGRSDWDARLGVAFSSSGAVPSASGFSRTEERRRGVLGGGSAYGYDPRQSRISTFSAVGREGSSGIRRHVRGGSSSNQVRQPLGGSSLVAPGVNPRYSYTPSAMGSAYNYAPDFEAVGEDPALAPMPRKLNFAQRFLLANDDAVLSITDLWVAAAINGDEAYPPVDEYEVADEGEFYDGDDDDAADLGEEGDSQALDSSFDVASSGQNYGDDDDDEDRSEVSCLAGASGIGNDGVSEGGRDRPYLPPLNLAHRRRGSKGARITSTSSRPRSMRLSSFHGRVPSLYNNTGIDLPSLWNEAPTAVALGSNHEGTSEAAPQGCATNRYDPTLADIPESHSARNTLGRMAGQGAPDERQHPLASTSEDGTSMADDGAPLLVAEKEAAAPSLWALLPLTIIAHYGLLAFHSAMFEQVFMAFLVTPFPSGGLGLTAAHYAELISAMAFCQIGFQFYFYPKIGPPQGQLSHLSMMRLGTLLYLPTYTLFPLLRNFLHPQTDALVMTFMIVFASMRWLANICAFTAVSILMNALTPPNLVPLANGLAQTTSSAARFLGPILGGLVWAKGISGDFAERLWPWNYHLGFWFVGLAGFAGFMHATFVLRSSAST